ncbi:hypothetical protein EVAR_56859_1 [Eumeta japonica]|uniref:Uncharacterized protein n=1 Tax=Eumeta variegata TaxID=151549 RepID=A0A4C1YXW0_EUMVA|nr:hypothetical protein EVAR_56859_1 [Eumeta japonica]
METNIDLIIHNPFVYFSLFSIRPKQTNYQKNTFVWCMLHVRHNFGEQESIRPPRINGQSCNVTAAPPAPPAPPTPWPRRRVRVISLPKGVHLEKCPRPSGVLFFQLRQRQLYANFAFP